MKICIRVMLWNVHDVYSRFGIVFTGVYFYYLDLKSLHGTLSMRQHT